MDKANAYCLWSIGVPSPGRIEMPLMSEAKRFNEAVPLGAVVAWWVFCTESGSGPGAMMIERVPDMVVSGARRDGVADSKG